MLRQQRCVDVFHAVKTLRNNKPNMVDVLVTNTQTRTRVSFLQLIVYFNKQLHVCVNFLCRNSTSSVTKSLWSIWTLRNNNAPSSYSSSWRRRRREPAECRKGGFALHARLRFGADFSHMYMLFIVNHDDSTDLYVVFFMNGTSDHIQRGFLWKTIRVENEWRKVFILSCSLNVKKSTFCNENHQRMWQLLQNAVQVKLALMRSKCVL